MVEEAIGRERRSEGVVITVVVRLENGLVQPTHVQGCALLGARVITARLMEECSTSMVTVSMFLQEAK